MSVLVLLIDIYSIIVFVSVILSWLSLSPDNPLVAIVARLTEPVLAPMRRVLPEAGGFDFSPMVLLFALRLLRRILVG